MIKALRAIQQKNKKAKLMKIRVDGLGFTDKVTIPKEFVKYFKVVDTEKLNKSKYIYQSEYYDGQEIINNTKEELKCFDKNESYHGSPGTGKTYEVKKEDKYDYACTVTNVCSLNIGTEEKKGHTIYSLLGLFNIEQIDKNFKKFRNKVIWVDEFSMIPKFIWNYLFILSSTYNTKFIISGDIKQIGPIAEKKINLNSDYFKSIMGFQTTLIKDYRNDNNIIKLRDMIKNEPVDLIKDVFKSREDNADWKIFKRHLCFTHEARNIINYSVLKKLNYKFEYKQKDDKIIYDISVGCILACRLTKKNENIFKNDLWEVINCLKEKDGYVLKNCLRNEVHIFNNDLMRYFDLGFATTTHSSQVLTIKEDVCIH